MYAYDNGYFVFREKSRKRMTDFLISGAGQVLSGLPNRENFIIETISTSEKITVNLVSKVSGNVVDSATATLVKE